MEFDVSAFLWRKCASTADFVLSQIPEIPIFFVLQAEVPCVLIAKHPLRQIVALEANHEPAILFSGGMKM
jgi:hypothetical protein